MKKYDIAIIGSGCGLMVLEASLAAGFSCAVVERSKFGGTCLNRGCIPSKMLVYPADVIRESQEAENIGLRFQAPAVDWGRISSRMWRQIGHNKTIENSLSQAERLDMYKGTGAFTGPGRMKVSLSDGGETEFKAERFVLAPGARSSIPPIEGLESTGYVTSESFFGEKFPDKPWESLLVIGGGAAGAEFAHIFSSLGTRVTVVDRNPRILTKEEEEVSAFVEERFTHYGIEIRTNTRILSASAEDGIKKLVLEEITSGKRSEIRGSEILVCSGLHSNTDLLSPENAQVRTDARGWIETNEYLETSANNVWALGDINGKYQFRHKANYEAGILINNLFGSEKKKADYSSVPWAIFTHPQVAHVGLTESEAKTQGLRVFIGRNFYSEIAGGISMGFSRKKPGNGFVKIVAGENRKILGVHIAGPYAAILVQPFVYLMNAGFHCDCGDLRKEMSERGAWQRMKEACPQIGTLLPISESMVIHPSMSELAAWAIDGIDWNHEA